MLIASSVHLVDSVDSSSRSSTVPEGGAFSAEVRHLAEKGKASFDVTPSFRPSGFAYEHVQKAFGDFVQTQRVALLQSPSSSKSKHLEALNVLEAREGLPASGAALVVKFTGRAVGGMPGQDVGKVKAKALVQLEALQNAKSQILTQLDEAKQLYLQVEKGASSRPSELSRASDLRAFNIIQNLEIDASTKIQNIDAQIRVLNRRLGR